MKYRLVAVLLILMSFPVIAAPDGGAFSPLFNGRDLQGWDAWLGAREVPTLPIRLWGDWESVVGMNQDVQGVFSVVQEDGTPAIRVSGETWGALVSKQNYSNYHLRLQYKWGERKYPPRDNKPRNTGLLYHSTGANGAFWSYWMRSAEFEIMEGSTGNFTSVDGVGGTIATTWDFSLPAPWLRYLASGSETSVGGMVFRVQANADREKLAGQWNILELYVLGDQAVHLVNGASVLSVRQLRQPTEEGVVPLGHGKIQLQSEGAEVFFRNIELRKISSIPPQEPARSSSR
jgi:hypothetical protein